MILKYQLLQLRKGVMMSRKLPVLMLLMSILLVAPVMADDKTTTTSIPQPPKFENGTPPDFNGGNFTNGQPPEMSGENGKSDVQNRGGRPSKKPDLKPGGDKTPQQWDASSNNGQNGQPPRFNGNNFNGRPPMPPEQSASTTSSES